MKTKQNQICVSAGTIAENPYRRLLELRRILPGVVVKGIRGLTRAVISETPIKDGPTKGMKKQLLVEGEGLREVMTTDGASIPLLSLHFLINDVYSL